MSKPQDPMRRALLVGAIASAGLATVSKPAVAKSADEELDDDAGIMADVVTDALNAWLSSAEYVGGEIHGVVLYGGSLQSGVDVQTEIESGLVDEGVDEGAATLIAETVASSWQDWADDWSMSNVRAFPDFAAVSTPEAPVTEAVAVDLKPNGTSSFRKLKSKNLEKSLVSALKDKISIGDPIKGTHSVSDLVHSFAWKVGQRVEDWSAVAMVEGIFGSGPVPTFAPPYVPVGPVVGGKSIDGVVTITEI